MEHFYFEAQLCSEIANLKEKSKKINKKMEESFDWWSQCRECLPSRVGVYLMPE